MSPDFILAGIDEHHQFLPARCCASTGLGRYGLVSACDPVSLCFYALYSAIALANALYRNLLQTYYYSSGDAT